MTTNDAIGHDDPIRLLAIEKQFLSNGTSGTPPQFEIFLGDRDTGNIPHRHNPDGFVHFDFGEVLAEVRNIRQMDDATAANLTNAALYIILGTALKNRMNIAMELSGNDPDNVLQPVKDAMDQLGYRVTVTHVDRDPDDTDRQLYRDAQLAHFYGILGLEFPKLKTEKE